MSRQDADLPSVEAATEVNLGIHFQCGAQSCADARLVPLFAMIVTTDCHAASSARQCVHLESRRIQVKQEVRGDPIAVPAGAKCAIRVAQHAPKLNRTLLNLQAALLRVLEKHHPRLSRHSNRCKVGNFGREPELLQRL